MSAFRNSVQFHKNPGKSGFNEGTSGLDENRSEFYEGTSGLCSRLHLLCFCICFAICFCLCHFSLLCFAMLCPALLFVSFRNPLPTKYYFEKWMVSALFSLPVFFALPCYALLCFALLCPALLCFAMLSFAMLCYALGVPLPENTNLGVPFPEKPKLWEYPFPQNLRSGSTLSRKTLNPGPPFPEKP